jgi:hypothetical protein
MGYWGNYMYLYPMQFQTKENGGGHNRPCGKCLLQVRVKLSSIVIVIKA